MIHWEGIPPRSFPTAAATEFAAEFASVAPLCAYAQTQVGTRFLDMDGNLCSPCMEGAQRDVTDTVGAILTALPVNVQAIDYEHLEQVRALTTGTGAGEVGMYW